MTKPSILYLVHRIPYPPDKGDKIRSFHLLEYLLERYRVHLGAFVDDDEDWQYESELARRVESLHLEALKPLHAKLKSVSGLLSGSALTLPYYRSQPMQRWVNEQASAVSGCVVFSSSMAQYVENDLYEGKSRCIDFVDIDSDKWTQYAARSGPVANWIYTREGRRLFDYERSVATQFDLSLFVSEDESKLFQTKLNGSEANVDFYPNGVDQTFFVPGLNSDNPFASDNALVFVGAMDYWANVDGAIWFAETVLPLLRNDHTELRFYIVGRNPDPKLRAIESENVIVTGGVADVRPYVEHAACVVAPLRIARGIQNKVLEALAMGRPIVGTEEAMEGLVKAPLVDALTVPSPEQFAERIKAGLDGELPGPDECRAYITEHYGWDASFDRLDALFEHAGMMA